MRPIRCMGTAPPFGMVRRLKTHSAPDGQSIGGRMDGWTDGRVDGPRDKLSVNSITAVERLPCSGSFCLHFLVSGF